MADAPHVVKQLIHGIDKGLHFLLSRHHLSPLCFRTVGLGC